MNSYYEYLYTKKLNLNLEEIRNSSVRMYNFINEYIHEDGLEQYGGRASKPTLIFKQYNVFLYPYNQFYELFHEIKDAFKFLSKPTEPHYMQAWINVYQRGEYIDWHNHWLAGMGVWHGFYCVDVEREPSHTLYDLPGRDEIIQIDSYDNLLVIGKSEDDKHKSSEWNNEHPRVTIAFDIVPAKHIDWGLNHWIPV